VVSDHAGASTGTGGTTAGGAGVAIRSRSGISSPARDPAARA
jgi:hypothetical protein